MLRTVHLLFVLLCVVVNGAPQRKAPKDQHPDLPPVIIANRGGVENPELDSVYWIEEAQKIVRAQTNRRINSRVAKNVILFIGDGMSIPTISAARVYQGGEETKISFEKFPWIGLSKTYSVDRQVADSACSATAYLGGVKANYGTIGVGPRVLRKDCQAQANRTNHVLSIAHYSQNKGKKTGLVTTARVTHASPAGVYSHVADREWEADTDIISRGKDPSVCMDSARQLLYGETGRRLDVILGGGRGKFRSLSAIDEEGQPGERSDGLDLIQEWKSTGSKKQYVWNRKDLLKVRSNTEKLLGLFGHDHLDYNLERDRKMDPSLAEMTEAAIKVLQKGNKGFFLFVEGARIDMGHHDAKAKLALDETIELSKAVERAISLTSEEDTLIVVTSDHAHTLSYSGYAKRNDNIFGFGGVATDNIPYFTLTYANGPGYVAAYQNGTRHDPTQDNYNSKDYVFPSYAPHDFETHGGEDVGIFARGPQAHLFSGVIEQNAIPHLMAYASCVSEESTLCDNPPIFH